MDKVELRTLIHTTVIADMDQVMLQRALCNLADNALAHTPRGGAISMKAEKDKNFIKVTVADNGGGIQAADLAHVFDRFYRADRARSNSSNHAGLGLAIVKSIASLHQGSVEITSEVGRGTTISLLFPIAKSEELSRHKQ